MKGGAFLLALAGACGGAAAQNQSDFVNAFSGDWSIVDARFGTPAGRCRIGLSATAAGDRYALSATNCGGELAGASSWGILDNQLALLDGSGKALARLGGNQRRITGVTASGGPVILDRSEVAANFDLGLQRSLRASGCFFQGFSQRCAALSELSVPISSPLPAGYKVAVVADLNVRTEPRDDAAIAGVVARNSCVAVNDCLVAADGAWCKASFGQSTGWMRKVALRNDRWPIVTFLNQCDASTGQEPARQVSQ